MIISEEELIFNDRTNNNNSNSNEKLVAHHTIRSFEFFSYIVIRAYRNTT